MAQSSQSVEPPQKPGRFRTLTSEVFSLEVTKSGFHSILQAGVEAGGSYDGILASFNGQLGFEGKAVLKALLATNGSRRQ